MKNENLNIEDLFRQSFNGHKIEPPANLWNKINYKLNLKQFFKADFKTFNIYYSSLIVGLISTVALLLFNGPEDEKLLTNNGEILEVNKNIINNSTEINNNNKITYEIKAIKDKMEQKYSSTVPFYISKQIEYQDNSQSSQIPVEIHKINPVLLMDKDTLNTIKSIIPNRPKPLFSITSKEGCTPFELRLNNFTQGANNFYWTFGDGGKSKDREPVYTYNYPGIYRIQLKAEGEGGVAISIIDSIVVHDKPSIKVNWPYESEFYVGEKIVVPIESQNAKRFECDFGDGTIINRKRPEHSYKSAGKYSINVKSWSETGCFDSIKIADISVVKNDNKIIFPSAFSPNPDGTSTGKYYDKESHVDIFHPITNAPIAEYKLIIYSRSGIIVFESTNLKIGWDGYYENKLMPEGVYPYVTTGKFENGKDFLIKGNLTIIYRK